MGSIDRRIEALEKLYGMDEDLAERERRTEEMRAEIRADMQRIEQGEIEIEPWRLAAIEELKQSIERRRARES